MDTSYRIDDVYSKILDEVINHFDMDGCTIDGVVQVSDELEVNYYISVSVYNDSDEYGHDYSGVEVDDVLLYYYNVETDEEVELDTDELEDMVLDACQDEFNEQCERDRAWEETKASICHSNGWGW